MKITINVDENFTDLIQVNRVLKEYKKVKQNQSFFDTQQALTIYICRSCIQISKAPNMQY